MIGTVQASVRILLASALVGVGCGRAPARLGVIVNEVAITKARIDPDRSPQGGGTEEPDETSDPPARKADLLGDEALETVVALPRGQGLEIRNGNGQRVSAITTPGYLTDFGILPALRPDKQDLVLYVYPNDSGGGTFTVLTPGERVLASWEERSPPGRFAIGRWDGHDAILYLRSAHLVVRSRDARALAEVAVPEGDLYDVRETIVLGSRAVVLASGGGYRPFHMVLVLERDGTLVFAEVDPDHGLGLESSGTDTFIVRTRSGRWRYSLPASRVP